MKKCIVHLTEKERKEKEREMLSRRGNEIPREGREIFGRDSIMSSNGYFTLPTVMSTTGGGRVSIGRYVSHAILSLSLSTIWNMAQELEREANQNLFLTFREGKTVFYS